MAIKIRVILKNGKDFVMECESLTTKYSTATSELTSFRYDGCEKNRPLYLDLSQVVAVLQEEGGHGTM